MTMTMTTVTMMMEMMTTTMMMEMMMMMMTTAMMEMMTMTMTTVTMMMEMMTMTTMMIGLEKECMERECMEKECMEKECIEQEKEDIRIVPFLTICFKKLHVVFMHSISLMKKIINRVEKKIKKFNRYLFICNERKLQYYLEGIRRLRRQNIDLFIKYMYSCIFV